MTGQSNFQDSSELFNFRKFGHKSYILYILNPSYTSYTLLLQRIELNMHEGQPKALYSNGKLIISPTYFHSLSDKRCCTLYVFARGGIGSALLTVYAN